MCDALNGLFSFLLKIPNMISSADDDYPNCVHKHELVNPFVFLVLGFKNYTNSIS